MAFILAGLLSAQAESPLSTLMRTYLQAVEELHAQSRPVPPEKLKKFQKEWMLDLVDGVAKSPKDDPFRATALTEISALYHALGDYENSLQTMRVLESDYPQLRENFAFMKSYCEVLMMVPPAVDSAKVASKILASFEKTVLLINRDASLPSVFSFLSLYAKCAALAGNSRALQSCLDKGLSQIKDRLSNPGETSPDLSRQDRIFLQGFFTAVIDGTLALNSPDSKEQVTMLLDRIFAMEVLATPKSSYVFQFADQIDPQHGKVFRDFSLRFVETMPADDFTAKLQYHLANSYRNESEPIRAAKLYSNLMQSSLGVTASTKDPKIEAYSRGILFGLADSLHKMGENEQAKKLFQQYRQLFPHDKRLSQIPAIP